MTRTTTSRLTTTAALAALALAATTTGAAPTAAESAPPAPRAAAAAYSGGTLTFIRDHDVWIARGDGSGARALTTDGTFAHPYGSPSQSDGGVVVATHGERIVRMTQTGRVLNTLDPHPLPTSVGIAIDGNVAAAAISPNGARIAYTFTKYLTPSGASSGFRSATGYTAADRLTDPAPHRTTYFWAPSWVGNGRTLQTGGYGSQVQLHDVGRAPVHWFDDSDIYEPSTDLSNATLSRDGRSLAVVRGYDEDSYVFWYAVNGDARTVPAPADPTPLCQIGPAEGITNPTWAPDSDSLAWEESDGIWTRSGARDCSVPSRLVIRGGSEPHWSPAGLSAPATVKSIRNTQRPTVRGVARVGRTLSATAGRWSVAGLRVSFQWLRNGRPIADRDRTHRLTRADRGKRLSVRVTVSKAGHRTAAAASASVSVRR